MFARSQKRSTVAPASARLSFVERQACPNGSGEMLNELRRARYRLQQQRQQQQQQQKQQQQQGLRVSPADDSLISNEDEDLYAARMRYLKQNRRPSQNREHRRPPQPRSLTPPPDRYGLINFANATTQPQPQKVGHKTIQTYSSETRQPTKDLKILVLALVRRHLRDEVLHMSEIAIEQNPFEMGNMRLNSFIANTPDLMDHWKVMMLEEGMRIIDESLESSNLDWVAPSPFENDSAKLNRQFPMPIDEQMLVSLPPDKPEISRSQVATEYIQAQRGRHGQETDEAAQLFQSELLKADKAAAATAETFERVCTSYKAILQKAVEIEYIENKPETCEAVSKYMDQLKDSVDKVVSDSLANDIKDTQNHGSTFLHCLIVKIMNDLHAAHLGRDFEPMRLTMTAHRRD